MSSEQALKTAQMIKEDRNGADYYKNPEILAGFLSGQLNISHEEARKIANHIADDRQGADYYEDVNILAQYLDGLFR